MTQRLQVGGRRRADRWARLAWSVVAVTLLLFAFALIGTVGRNPRFVPVAAEIDLWAMALLALVFLAFSVVGALVASRDPRNAVGWLFLSIAASVAVTLASLVYVQTALLGRWWADWLSEWNSVGTFAQLPLVLLLFPDGKLPSRRWRPVAWVCALNGILLVGGTAISPYSYEGHPFTNPVGIEGLPGLIEGGALAWTLLPLVMLAGAAGFVIRFRRSAGERRQQLKWFALAAAIVAAGYMIQQASWSFRALADTNLPAIATVTLILCVMTIPLASGIAILRYRLYDIDILINRTLVYAALTAVLGLVYAGGAVAIGGLIQEVSGRRNDNIVVAASTLAVAAAIRPARLRIQNFIDHRFYRRKYDAATAASEFSARVRSEVDIQSVSQHLIAVIEQTMQPSHVSLWLKRT